MNKKFNGHKNWNHWNVSLWINNDERLYRMATRLVCSSLDRDHAAGIMIERLSREGVTHTPDGAPYSKTSIRAAMIGM